MQGPIATPRDLELAELRSLYDRVSRTQFPDATAVYNLLLAYFEALEYELSKPLQDALTRLISDEKLFREPPDFNALTLKQVVELKKKLRAWELKVLDGQELAEDFIVPLFVELAEHLPKAQSPSPFTIPFVHALPNAKAWITKLNLRVCDERYLERELFEKLRMQLYLNLCYASEIEPYKPTSKKPKQAVSSDQPLSQLAHTYLRRTPFDDLFQSPVPLQLTHKERFNHMHVLAGSGHGKTTLIEQLIRHDLGSADPPTIVLIDPHSDLVRKLVRSDLGIADRLIYIDPRDTKFPVALNPFAVNQERLTGYDDAIREQVTAGVIQTFGYLFNGLTNLTLTGKQDVFFKYVTRLMLSLPQVEGRNATILDMLHLMKDPLPYARAIEALPEIPSEFFKTDFMSKTFDQTKEQIRYRLQALIESPTMARLFTAPETKIDFFTEMNRGAVILVDTAKDFLKEGSAAFGKLMVSLILQAVLERASVPEDKRKPTFIMIDEAGSFFSQNIDDLLTEARKYKAGLVLAHQYLDQASTSLRASLHANTGTKLVGGLSAGDASAMARELRTSSDFILEQPKLHFAAHIRGVTQQAVSIPIGFPESPLQLTEEAFADLIAANRARVSLAKPVVAESKYAEQAADFYSERSPGKRRNFFDKRGEPEEDEKEW